MLEELQSSLYHRAKENRDAKFNTLHDKIYRMDVLEEAWKHVSENRGAEGIDNETIDGIKSRGVGQFLEQIQHELKTATYRAECVRRVFIPKHNGKMRPLGIPTVRDRVVQAAVKLVIEPIFEACFQPFSYGYRPGKSAKDATLEIYKWLNFGLTNVIDVDIASFFDHIDHELLISFVKERVTDGYIISLIKQWLKAGVVYMNSVTTPAEGTPQGGVISPLLANIYLNKIDQAWVDMDMENRTGHNAHMIRFADDVLILTGEAPSFIFSGKAHAKNIMNILNMLLGKLKLSLSSDKSRTTTAEEGFDFLGFHFLKRYRERYGREVARFFPSRRAMNSFREKVSEMTARRHTHTKSESGIIGELNRFITGWTNYYNHSYASETYRRLWNFVCWKLAQFIRYRHKLKRLRIDHEKLRSYGLKPLWGRIRHACPVSPW